MKLLTVLSAATCCFACFPASASPRYQTAVLAGGCYWGTEAVFEHVVGVKDVVAGFAGIKGGLVSRNSGAADPAEAVSITYDPAVVSYDQLLDIFFSIAHDPSQIDRQGPDVGHKYRSAIFPMSKEQSDAASRLLAGLRASGRLARVATRIEHGGFEAAPRDQQDFVRNHPGLPYVVVNDLPKLAQLKRRYPQFWKS